jgi:ABC-type bacteriocin/lantibiotic exporter with double-glycine peptidase domain
VTLLIFDSNMVLLLFVVLLPPIYFVSTFVKSKLAKVRENIKHTNEKALQFLQESLRGYVEASIFEKKGFFTNRFVKEQTALNSYLSILQSTQNNSHRILEVFAISGLFLLFTLHTYVASSSTETIINIGIFLGAAYKLIPGTIKIINLSGQIKTFGFSAETLANEPVFKNKTVESKKDQVLDSVTFDKIGFSYQDKTILKDFSITLLKGDFVALIAQSGKGKTTFINLLVGFLEEREGEIQFNSEVLKASERRLFWKNISYLKQDAFIINDSVLKNITMDDENLDQKLLDEAIIASGLDAFLSKQEAGINYMIAENGKNISGGQLQRIALARAFYKKSDLYILDEALNELDSEGEKTILKYLKKLADHGAIVLLISHNRRSHTYCNKIISLDQSEKA